ncbi:MAG: thioredoxin family protein [Candidatus Rokuibacteriota bacterium]
MVTKERFAQGMTLQQYLDQMGTNKERFVQFLNEIKVDADDRAALERLGKKLKVLVITEDWCGDALYNVPVLAKLVEGNPNVEMRLFLRDKNPDLMDQYLNQGMYRSIPVFAFFDENMNEVARFIERPPAHTEELEKKMLEVRRALRTERYLDWRGGVVKEIRSLLKA